MVPLYIFISSFFVTLIVALIHFTTWLMAVFDIIIRILYRFPEPSFYCTRIRHTGVEEPMINNMESFEKLWNKPKYD